LISNFVKTLINCYYRSKEKT